MKTIFASVLVLAVLFVLCLGCSPHNGWVARDSYGNGVDVGATIRWRLFGDSSGWGDRYPDCYKLQGALGW
jgi:hypothetical protein